VPYKTESGDDVCPKIIAAKRAQNQPREFYWKKRRVALRITVQKFVCCYCVTQSKVTRGPPELVQHFRL
jgi:hypothetical protein